MFRPRRISSLAWILAIPCGVVLCMSVGCQSAWGPSDSARRFQAGDYQGAAQRLQQSLARNPRDAESYYSLGRVHHQAGLQTNDQNQLLQAENLYNSALDLNPNHVAAYRSLAVLLTETNRPDKAFTLISRWGADPRNPPAGQSEARVELARLYEEFGDKRKAEEYLQQAVNLNATNARAWAALGKLREETGDSAQALANYQRSYQLNRFQPAIADRIAMLESRGVFGGSTVDGWPGGRFASGPGAGSLAAGWGTGVANPNAIATGVPPRPSPGGWGSSWGSGTSVASNWGQQQPLPSAWGGGPPPSSAMFSSPWSGSRMVNAPGPMRRY